MTRFWFLSFLAISLTAPAAAQAQVSNRVSVAWNTGVHAGPGTAYPQVDIVQRGEQVRLYGCLQDYAWCDIGPLHQGRYSAWRGWVRAQDLHLWHQQQPYFLHQAQNDLPWFTYPLIGFALDQYWGQHYTDRSWYSQRQRWSTWDWRPSNQNLRWQLRQERYEDRRDDHRDWRNDRQDWRQEQLERQRREARQEQWRESQRQEQRYGLREDRRDWRQDRRDEQRQEQRYERREYGREQRQDLEPGQLPEQQFPRQEQRRRPVGQIESQTRPMLPRQEQRQERREAVRENRPTPAPGVIEQGGAEQERQQRQETRSAVGERATIEP